MGAVAKRLVGALAAAAEGNHGASGQAERGTRGIQNLELAINTDGTVVEYSNFRWHSRGWYHGGNAERTEWRRAHRGGLPAKQGILLAFRSLSRRLAPEISLIARGVMGWFGKAPRERSRYEDNVSAGSAQTDGKAERHDGFILRAGPAKSTATFA